MPQRMMAFKKAFRWRALKPSTWAGGAAGLGSKEFRVEEKDTGRGGDGGAGGETGAGGLHLGQDPKGTAQTKGLSPPPTSTWHVTQCNPTPPVPPPHPGVAAGVSSLL